MAIQINWDEYQDTCPSYFQWLNSKLVWEMNDKGTVKLGKNTDKNSAVLGRYTARNGPFVEMLGYLFDTDFVVMKEVPEDEIRVTDAMGLRRRYADEVGFDKGKSKRDIDRIWKSIHGKCSVLEFILQLCFRLDEMLNEDEPGEMVSQFFGIFMRNLELDPTDSKDVLKEKIDRFMYRKYESDGSKGGLFPIKIGRFDPEINEKSMPIWDQMGRWVSAHLDENAHFSE